ncbi:MAG: hypothetical protein H6R13_1177 [Proteobacteria bacterium]|nr:hypothetical protein [Pseudomonadota bacterium]
MPLIQPFRGLRPAEGRAEEVAAPPYDVLSSSEARERATAQQLSFLHISKAEIDLPVDTDPYAAAVYAKSAENFQRLIAHGILIRDAAPCYYAYRLTMGDHEQTGIVAVASVADYNSNRIRKHEFTRPDKEDDRVRQIEALSAQTGPVLLAYPDSARADALISSATDKPPIAEASFDGVRHTVWLIDDADIIAGLNATFDAMPNLYIADGHHRSAAASRVAAAHAGTAGAGYFLSVIFPAHQMRIMDYNRVVRDLNGLSPDDFLDSVGKRFSICPAASRVRPEKPGVIGMYLSGRWYRLEIDPTLIPVDDPVRRLDVSLLSEQLLAPILGIGDLRRDKRIDFVGGIRGLTELEQRVDSGEMAVAFAMHATQMSDLMAVADSGQVMPPKSTWFEPKLADGLVSHIID